MINPIRSNGFQKPYEVTQVISWVLFGYLGVLYFGIAVPSFWGYTSTVIELTIPFVVGAITVFASAYAATTTNPVDPYVAARDWSRSNMTDDRIRLVRETMPLHTEWCYNCKWYVGKNSYHCRRCDKCSDGLDHHCTFLNNCIGSRNYAAFITCTGSAASLIGYQLVLYLYLIVYSYQNEDDLVDSLESVYGSFSINFYRILLISTMLLLFGGFLLLSQLLVFHIFLWYRGQLTHEYLMGDKSFQASHMQHESRRRKPRDYAYCGFASKAKKAENEKDLASELSSLPSDDSSSDDEEYNAVELKASNTGLGLDDDENVEDAI